MRIQPSTVYGNRKGGSAAHYLVYFIQFVLSEAQAGRCVHVLAMDHSKVFDGVDITVAMKHLLDLNVRAELIP